MPRKLGWKPSLFYLFQLGISSLMWLIFQTSLILCNKWRLLSKNHLLTWRCGKKAEELEHRRSCQCTFWPSDADPLGFLTSRTPKETTLNSLFFAPRSNELLPLMHIAQEIEKKPKVSAFLSATFDGFHWIIFCAQDSSDTILRGERWNNSFIKEKKENREA